jgi:hypothetical protein
MKPRLRRSGQQRVKITLRRKLQGSCSTSSSACSLFLEQGSYELGCLEPARGGSAASGSGGAAGILRVLGALINRMADPLIGMPGTIDVIALALKVIGSWLPILGQHVLPRPLVVLLALLGSGCAARRLGLLWRLLGLELLDASGKGGCSSGERKNLLLFFGRSRPLLLHHPGSTLGKHVSHQALDVHIFAFFVVILLRMPCTP